ncbi:MAG: hypothetical protein GYA82_03825 [Synergistaceae bacterium]|nr:hypothetical protein [Synergistaceae bacterium]
MAETTAKPNPASPPLPSWPDDVYRILKEAGVRPVIGARGEAEEVARAFLDGTLQCGDSSCGHVTGEGHGEHHHH